MASKPHICVHRIVGGYWISNLISLLAVLHTAISIPCLVLILLGRLRNPGGEDSTTYMAQERLVVCSLDIPVWLRRYIDYIYTHC